VDLVHRLIEGVLLKEAIATPEVPLRGPLFITETVGARPVNQKRTIATSRP